MDRYSMTPELKTMLSEWLTSDDEAKRHHAQWRLSQSNPLEYPPLFQQAVNAARAVGSVVSAAVHGEPITVPQEEQDRRLAICHSCEFWDAKQSRCSKCGCFGQWKTWLASQKCPVGKW